jgi:hypothetical protein
VTRTKRARSLRQQAVHVAVGGEQLYEAFQVAGAGRGPESGDEATV